MTGKDVREMLLNNGVVLTDLAKKIRHYSSNIK